MEVVKVKKISFGYHGMHDVIKDIDLSVNQGDFLCIVGENGSGKSTLIKCILGLNKGYKGEITVNERVGYLPQMTEIQNNFPASIEEVVLSGTIPNNIKRIWYSRDDKSLANEIMQKLELYDIRKKCFRELSGGQKQRVLIARAMCSTGKILVLDEPANGLDPNVSKQLYKILSKLNKENGVTIIMVSHDVDRAINFCTRVVEIEKGKIVFNGEPSKYGLGGSAK